MVALDKAVDYEQNSCIETFFGRETSQKACLCQAWTETKRGFAAQETAQLPLVGTVWWADSNWRGTILKWWCFLWVVLMQVLSSQLKGVILWGKLVSIPRVSVMSTNGMTDHSSPTAKWGSYYFFVSRLWWSMRAGGTEERKGWFG